MTARTMADLGEMARNAGKPRVSPVAMRVITRESGNEPILSFPIIGHDHEDVVAGKRAPDDVLVRAVKDAVNRAGITQQDLFDQVGGVLKSRQEAFQIVYRLRERSSITAPLAERWAGCLGCHLEVHFVPMEVM